MAGRLGWERDSLLAAAPSIMTFKGRSPIRALTLRQARQGGCARRGLLHRHTPPTEATARVQTCIRDV